MCTSAKSLAGMLDNAVKEDRMTLYIMILVLAVLIFLSLPISDPRSSLNGKRER
jgi:hypothetical protein